MNSHLLIIVGEEIYINEIFLNYVLSRYKQHFMQTPLIRCVGDCDKELPFIIENYAQIFNDITIIASENNFSTISKMLCTIGREKQDKLELRQNTLMPSVVTNFIEDSFIINLLESKINLIKATPTKKLPQILLENNEKIALFYLLDIDDKSVQMVLSPLGDTYNIAISTTSVLNRLVFVKAISHKFGQIEAFLNEVRKTFATQFIDDKNIVSFIVKNLARKNLSISLAESCTCGLAAAKIGQISGASEVFSGSLVTYSNNIKNVWLNVSEDTLNTYGAVSKECVLEMATGARNISGADFSIAISGIAGPSGASEDKPVGRVYIAVCNKDKNHAAQFDFDGDRDYIREQSALSAYFLLLKTFWEEIVM